MSVFSILIHQVPICDRRFSALTEQVKQRTWEENVHVKKLNGWSTMFKLHILSIVSEHYLVIEKKKRMNDKYNWLKHFSSTFHFHYKNCYCKTFHNWLFRYHIVFCQHKFNHCTEIVLHVDDIIYFRVEIMKVLYATSNTQLNTSKSRTKNKKAKSS